MKTTDPSARSAWPNFATWNAFWHIHRDPDQDNTWLDNAAECRRSHKPELYLRHVLSAEEQAILSLARQLEDHFERERPAVAPLSWQVLLEHAAHDIDCYAIAKHYMTEAAKLLTV